jgi:hypothetical protein
MVVPAAAAHAGVGVYVNVGGPRPVEYVPPCPGNGYYWTPGYYAYGSWVPGRWAVRAYYGDYDRHYYRDYDHYRDYDRDRHWDRDRDRGRDRDWDHDRDRHEGWRR